MIASGGAGKPEDFERVLTEGDADAALAASIFHYGTYTVGDLKKFLDRTRESGEAGAVIIPCIDLMDGKVVQLVQGREKALEGGSPLEMLRAIRARFREIQVIDLDAAMGKGSNDDLVELVASRAVARVGGGVRSRERARALIEQGAYRVIVGTAAFQRELLQRNRRCRRTGTSDHRARFESRQSGGERLAGSHRIFSRGSDQAIGAVLLRFPVHLCRQRRHACKAPISIGSGVCARAPSMSSPPPAASPRSKKSGNCRSWEFTPRSAWRSTRAG